MNHCGVVGKDGRLHVLLEQFPSLVSVTAPSLFDGGHQVLGTVCARSDVYLIIKYNIENTNILIAFHNQCIFSREHPYGSQELGWYKI